jgi:predicted murein hydrolase (TIGR00659 family)
MIHSLTSFLYASEVFAVALTFVVYFIAQRVYARYQFFFLNPILLSVLFIILLLEVFNLPYEAYNKGGYLIGFLLKPAIVALGVPLYLQIAEIKQQKSAILWSQLAGCVIGIVSVVFFAKIFGASKPVILSLVPKSVTTPIAMEVSASIGGIPSLTAGVVITVGIFGAVMGVRFLKWLKVKDDAAVGISMGTAAHALGTARVSEISARHGAFGGLGLILNGIFTALLSPWIVKLIERWL